MAARVEGWMKAVMERSNDATIGRRAGIADYGEPDNFVDEVPEVSNIEIEDKSEPGPSGLSTEQKDEPDVSVAIEDVPEPPEQVQEPSPVMPHQSDLLAVRIEEREAGVLTPTPSDSALPHENKITSPISPVEAELRMLEQFTFGSFLHMLIVKRKFGRRVNWGSSEAKKVKICNFYETNFF